MVISLETIQHKLQQFDLGVVWLDNDNKITAMNGLAIKTLGMRMDELIGQEILQFHPEKSRGKVKWLIESSSCPMDSPPPMTMMINIPERVLMIKVTKMCSTEGEAGTCMMFYDLTDLTLDEELNEQNEKQRMLYKLPVYKDNQTLLIDLADVQLIKAEGHYSTLFTSEGNYLCNLSLSDLEGRLNARFFVRVHRSYIANMRYAKSFKKINEISHLVMDSSHELEIPISRTHVNEVKRLLGLDKAT